MRHFNTVILRGFTTNRPTATLPHFRPEFQSSILGLASTPRWFDSAANSWREGQTSWYTVCAYRKLAQKYCRLPTVGKSITPHRARSGTQQWQRETVLGVHPSKLMPAASGLDLTFGTSTFSRAVEHSGTQSHTQDDATSPIQKGCIAGRPCRSQQPSRYAVPKPRPSKTGPRGTASSPQREFSQPKNPLFQHLQMRTRLFNNLPEPQIVLSMRNKAIKYLKWHLLGIQHHNF